MLNPNWLAIVLISIYLIIHIIKRKDYQWFHQQYAVLSLSFLLILSTMRIDDASDAPYAFAVIIMGTIALIIDIVNIHTYRKNNNLIDYEKRKRRWQKRRKIIIIVLAIMIVIRIIYELQKLFNLI